MIIIIIITMTIIIMTMIMKNNNDKINNNDKVLMSNSSGGWLNCSKNHGDGDHPANFNGWAYWSTETFIRGEKSL